MSSLGIGPACSSNDNKTPNSGSSQPQANFTSLPWLHQSKTIKHNPKSKNETGLLQKFHTNKQVELNFLNLFEFSIPPLLARKYHIINISELMKDDKNMHYQTVATWFVSWNKTFGLEYLNDIQLKFYHLDHVSDEHDMNVFCNESLVKDKYIIDWQSRVDKALCFMIQAKSGDRAPTPSDCASKPEDFLLEACIIIQLPWCTVLLHQWLTAALVQVLVFEKDSLELKHWSLPEEVEPCARKFLWLLARLKERIILGFAILLQQMVCYPQVDTRHPGWILDQVVLPSLATLQFLINGKASSVLNSIKKTAWAKSETGEEVLKRVFVPQKCYAIDTKFCPDYCEHLFNQFSYWGLLGLCTHEACEYKDLCDYKKIEDFIKTLNANNDLILSSAVKRKVSKPPNCEEKTLISYIELELHKLLNDADKEMEERKVRVERTLANIKETVIDAGLLPAETWNLITELFDNDATKNAVGAKDLFFRKSKKNSIFTQAVMYTLIYEKAYSMLVGSDKEAGILTRLVNLGIEVVEREQTIRLASLGLMLDVSPIASNLDESAPLSVESMSELLKQVGMLRATQNREWLWSQFSEEWRKPVCIKKLPIKSNIKFQELIRKYENRIGRIIFNVAQKCFDVYEKGGEIFPHWQTVQYIVPCYVAMYNIFLQNPSEKFINLAYSNHLQFLENILEFYEKSYESWYTDIIPRQIPVNTNLEIFNIQNEELDTTLIYYKEITNLISSAYVCQTVGSPTKDLHGFRAVIAGADAWPRGLNTGQFDLRSIYQYLKSWILTGIQIAKALCDSYPSFRNILTIKDHIDIYNACEIMHGIDNVSTKCFATLIGKTVPDNILQRCENATMLRQKMCRLQFLVHGSLYSCRKEPAVINIHMKSLQCILELLCVHLKSFKIYIGPCKIQYMEHLPNNPPVLTEAAIHYLNSDFVELEKILRALNIEEPPSPSTSTAKSVPKETKIKEPAPGAKKMLAPKLCRNCPRTEVKRGSFLTCEKCQQDKYPDVNFYCSKACKYAWWKQEHMAEHLEFELGLSDFSHLNVDK